MTSMQAFSAVVTTGIYCRPRCGAQPLAQNVRQYLFAAAAEAAGYRACLRCRPYRVPPTADAANSELVCRAVGLILAGELDSGTEITLARRLGVSARHLRRLFMTEIGVTPDGLARSARTHFARRLLDDTDLTITEVAFASGFGSLRQFNRSCREVFRASPRELRSKRRRSDRLVADGGLALRLVFEGPLDWTAMVGFLAATAVPGVEQVRDGVYRRTVVIGGDPGLLELHPGGQDHLVLRAHLPHWEELLHVVHRARGIAGLDCDLDGPVGRLGGDPVVGPLVRARPGVRAPGTWDAFETGVRAIIVRHQTGASVTAVIKRLVARHGTPVAGLSDLDLSHTFPGPDVLAGAELSGLGFTQATADAVRTFARAVADGRVVLDRSVSLSHLVASIEALHGLDPWTANYVALRLGEPDACPLTVGQLARRLPTHDGQTHATHAEAVDRWRPWRALAVTHLWAAGGWSASLAQKGAA